MAELGTGYICGGHYERRRCGFLPLNSPLPLPHRYHLLHDLTNLPGRTRSGGRGIGGGRRRVNVGKQTNANLHRPPQSACTSAPRTSTANPHTRPPASSSSVASLVFTSSVPSMPPLRLHSPLLISTLRPPVPHATPPSFAQPPPGSLSKSSYSSARTPTACSTCLSPPFRWRLKTGSQSRKHSPQQTIRPKTAGNESGRRYSSRSCSSTPSPTRSRQRRRRPCR